MSRPGSVTGGEEAGKLLLVRYGRMGENLFWTSIPGALLSVHPERHISVLTNRPELWKAHPGIQEVLSFPPGVTKKSRMQEFSSLLAVLQEKKYDTIVVGQEPPGILEMLRLVGVPQLLDPEGLRSAGSPPSIASTHNEGKVDSFHRAEAAVFHAWPLGLGDSPWPMVFEVSQEARRLAKALLPSECRKLVLLNIGTHQTVRTWPPGRQDRTWPVRNFRECMEELQEVEGMYFFLSAHSSRERRRAKKLVKAFPAGKVIFPREAPDLEVLAALLQESDCLVTCDTGILHLASIQKTPVVAIFGPRARPEITGPYLMGDLSRVFVSGTREDPKPASMIRGAQVAGAVRELLAKDDVEGVGGKF